MNLPSRHFNNHNPVYYEQRSPLFKAPLLITFSRQTSKTKDNCIDFTASINKKASGIYELPDIK